MPESLDARERLKRALVGGLDVDFLIRSQREVLDGIRDQYQRRPHEPSPAEWNRLDREVAYFEALHQLRPRLDLLDVTHCDVFVSTPESFFLGVLFRLGLDAEEDARAAQNDFNFPGLHDDAKRHDD